MIKKIKLIRLNFGIITVMMASNSLTINTYSNNHYSMAKIKCRNKRQLPTPISLQEYDLGNIPDNTEATILRRLRTHDQFHTTPEEHAAMTNWENFTISNITFNSAHISRIDPHGNAINNFNVHFRIRNLSSIIRNYIRLRGTPANYPIDIGTVNTPPRNDNNTIIARIVNLINSAIQRQNPNWRAEDLYREEDVRNNISIDSYIDGQSLVLSNTDNTEERFTIKFAANSQYLQDYVTNTNLGIIENTNDTNILLARISARFYNLNPLLWNTHDNWLREWNVSYTPIGRVRDEKGLLTNQNQVSITYRLSYDFNALIHNITLRFQLSSDDEAITTTSTPFTDKQNRKPPGGGKPKASKSKNDSNLFAYDQPGTSGVSVKKHKPSTPDKSRSSDPCKTSKNYNLGVIKNNQKDTIINKLIHSDNNIKWKQQKPVIADFHFLAITPTSAKIKITKPMCFTFKNQDVTLSADEFINLSFNVTDQITVSSIIRVMAEKNFSLPLFILTNIDRQHEVTDKTKNERKNDIMAQIFSWLQYLKWAKPELLPTSLHHIKTNEQMLYDDDNITITELKLPQNKLGQVIATLKINNESEKIKLIFNEYSIKMFLKVDSKHAISIATKEFDPQIINALKVYFKNIQLQTDEFVDQINNQAKGLVHLGLISDQSDIAILKALVQYAENHKIKNIKQMKRLIYSIWTKTDHVKFKITIRVNNHRGKILFTGAKVINIAFTTSDLKPIPKIIKPNKPDFLTNNKDTIIKTLVGTASVNGTGMIIMGSKQVLEKLATNVVATAQEVIPLVETDSVIAGAGATIETEAEIAMASAPSTGGISLVIGGLGILGTAIGWTIWSYNK